MKRNNSATPWLIIVCLLLIGGMIYLSGNTNVPPNNPGPDFGPVQTAVAAYTPENRPGDIVNMVETAMPTPYHILTIPQVEALDRALKEKDVFEQTNYLIGSSLVADSLGWYCENIKLGDLDLPGSVFGSAYLIQAQWLMATRLSDIDFDVVAGSETAPVYHEDGGGLPYTESQYNGILIVKIDKPFLMGPTIKSGNQYRFKIGSQFGENVYQVWLLPREIVTGRDLVDEKFASSDVHSIDLAKFNSLAPDGSPEKMNQLLTEFKKSFTESGEGSIHDFLIATLEPLAREYGFAGIEGVRIEIGYEPTSIYDLVDEAGNRVIPYNFPGWYQETSMCPEKPNLEGGE